MTIRFHLSTLLVVTLTSSIVLYVNFTPRYTFAGYKLKELRKQSSILSSEVFATGETLARYGFPFTAAQKKWRYISLEWSWMLAFDIAFLVGVLIAIYMIFEGKNKGLHRASE